MRKDFGLLRNILIFSLLTGPACGDNRTGPVEDLPHTVSLVLLGRKGSGITSTVRQILGSRTTIHPAEVAVASTDILEYTLRLPTSPQGKDYNYLKLVDVPGLELGDNHERDAEILSTLKSYLHDKGLPTFFLVVYRFDDKHISEENSNFRQLLKAVEFLQRGLFQTTTDNTLFLMTRLLNEPISIQESPEARINEFRQIIQQSTTFPSPIEILVGDNKPDNSTQIENGFYKLPNNELYPKNVLDKLVTLGQKSILTEDLHETINQVVKSLTETRESGDYHTKEIVAHPTDEDIFESDLEAFEYLLRQEDLELPSNEIQSALQTAFEHQDAQTQITSCVQLLALRVALKNLKLIERISQVPQTLVEEVKFFQKDADGILISKYAQFYLKQALGLEVPEYPHENLVVGFGYDVIHDRILRTTPFLRNPTKRPSLGYQIPDFIECEKLQENSEAIISTVTQSITESRQERLNHLTFSDKDSLIIFHLEGEANPVTNLKPSASGHLTSAKEIRILECKITIENDTQAIVDEGFASVVNSLPVLNASIPQSLSEWRLFLHSYGTHLVTKSYGGGCYQADLFVAPQDSLLSADNANYTLYDLANLKNIRSQSPINQLYQFHLGVGGQPNPKTGQIHQLTHAETDKLIEEWTNQLGTQFEMLTFEMELVPMSQLIKVINPAKGADAEEATRLLYQGKLPTHVTPAHTHAELRENARKQSEKLRSANADKQLEQINYVNDFLAGVA